ncbi:MAG: hypothetical protein KIT68_02450 [Phycisphaeraceae bacterium]|nr:hypothetical protein [Phycisphaeraceae bacterium]
MSVESPGTRLVALAALAVLGTDRGGASTPEALLTRAAVLGAQARAGFKPARVPARLPACPADARPVVGPTSEAMLMRVLNEPDGGLIVEWAELAHAKGLRVPDSVAPALLDWWARQHDRPEVVFWVLGQRGAWLGELNEAWRKPVAGGGLPADAEGSWQTGTTPERIALLKTVRRVEPARGAALVQSTWDSDGAEERRRFVEVIGTGCTLADEPFLERVLDDRSRLVRRAAADALGRIPGSRYQGRMNERARGLIRVERTRGLLKRGVRGTLHPPQTFDESWHRDGVEERPASGTGQKAWWLRQILAAAELTVWTEATEAAPAEVLDAIAGDDYFETALGAIAEAAARRGDAAWCAAVVRRRLGNDHPRIDELSALWQNLPPDQREPLMLEAATHRRVSGDDMLTTLASSDHRWSRAMSAGALKLMSVWSGRATVAWQFLESLDRISRSIDPAMAERFAETVSAVYPDGPPERARASIDRVRLRADMHKEFAA